MQTQYVRATISYDGTDFLGYQYQSQGRTVQGVLETAIHRVTQHSTRVVGSGRTDRGVHARGQMIAFHVMWRHNLPDLKRALNAVLPRDVVVLDLDVAPVDWHPRFSALRRHYRYTVLNQRLRSPLDRRYAYQMAQPLNLMLMQTAAQSLVGQHDFASFGRPTQGSNTVREIFETDWRQDGAWFIFDVVGNAFLRRMVRCLAGALLKIGADEWPVDRMAEVLAARDRSMAPPPAPACGLCLMNVVYEDLLS